MSVLRQVCEWTDALPLFLAPWMIELVLVGVPFLLLVFFTCQLVHRPAWRAVVIAAGILWLAQWAAALHRAIGI